MDKDWRCQRYGPLGWMETIVKLLAIGVALGSLAVFDSADRVLRGTRIAEVVILGLLGALLIAELVQRILDKELFALTFKVRFFQNILSNIISQIILRRCLRSSFEFDKINEIFLFKYAIYCEQNNLLQGSSYRRSLDLGYVRCALKGSRSIRVHIRLPYDSWRIN